MKRIYKLGMAVCVISLALAHHQVAQAFDGTANVVATIISNLTMTTVSDLNFGEGKLNDVALQIPVGAAGSASFTVAGGPDKTYSIALPSDGDVNMTLDGLATADATKIVAVNTFLSNPAAGDNGVLDGSGLQTLNVGATRAAIPQNQATGSYSGEFTVVVAYLD